MNDPPECGNCRFCVLDKDGDGQCRRYPPTVITYHKDFGEVSRITVSSDMLKSR